jgi:preprotein translocase subunit SecE
MNSIMQYFRDVRGEMRHVTWPTRRQAVIYTSIVIGVSLVTAVYLGALDYLLGALIQRII